MPVAHALDVMVSHHLFDQQTHFIARALRGLGVRDVDLDDARQEVFLVVHRRRDDFEGRSSLRTWIYGICVRVASDHRRRRTRRREVLVEAPPDEGRPAPQHDELEQRRAFEALSRAVGSFDVGKRTVFVLHDMEELPMSVIAARVGCPLQTAYSRLHAARRLVGAALREAGVGVA